MKVFLKGLNTCALRRQKLQQYKKYFMANGHTVVTDPRASDVTIIWTCAFRADVRDYSLEEIDRYQKEYKAELVVGGCLPDIAPELLKKHFAGRVLLWRDDDKLMCDYFGSEKATLGDVSPIFVEKNICEDAQKYKEEHKDEDVIFHDQFLKLVVSEGCEFKCTYCSERLAFPPFHSFGEDELVDACRHMVAETGKHEVVLLADCLGDYGKDSGSSFPQLVRKLKTVHPDLRFALNNFNLINFVEYYDDMTVFLKEGTFIHLNLPIQSASDKILKLMDRPYTRADMEKIFGLLNEVGFKEFDTHIIIGFPGEEEKDYEESILFVMKYRPKHVLLSSYMELPHMDSAKIPHKVDQKTIKKRIRNAFNRINEAGIICNSDDSDLIQSRFRKMRLHQKNG